MESRDLLMSTSSTKPSGTRTQSSPARRNYFFEQYGIGEGDRIYLSIDETLRKKGDKIQAVGKFYDHSEGRYIGGNQFVTSSLQIGDAFILHKPRCI